MSEFSPLLFCLDTLALTIGGAINDYIPSRNLKYDHYLYDDVAGWNRKQRRRKGRPAPQKKSSKF